MFNPKKFKVSDRLHINLVGGINATDKNNAYYFHTFWKTMQKGRVIIVGRKDNKPNCFSLTPLEDGWDIAFYEGECPADKWLQLKNGENLGDAEFFQSDPVHKYVYLDLVKFMRDRGIHWR